jgi:pimeloyl-ACP methyl ester carboxylesterase
MTGFFFGASARQLFGYHHAARGRTRGGAVICPPIGREYMLSHGTLRHLARLLANAGHDVLRFDYAGTGDSAGDFETMSQPDWIADIGMAISELKDLAQLERVSLIGVRYGATLAALAAHGRGDVKCLVLWDPVLDGDAYLRELGVVHREMAGAIDVTGVLLRAGLRDHIGAITPAVVSAGLPRALFVLRADGGDQVASLPHADGMAPEVVRVPGKPIWQDEMIGSAGMPVHELIRIVEYLG